MPSSSVNDGYSSSRRSTLSNRNSCAPSTRPTHSKPSPVADRIWREKTVVCYKSTKQEMSGRTSTHDKRAKPALLVGRNANVKRHRCWGGNAKKAQAYRMNFPPAGELIQQDGTESSFYGGFEGLFS